MGLGPVLERVPAFCFSGYNLRSMIKVKLTRHNCLPYLYEIIDEYGEASTYYGTKMDRPGEEQAAEEYERAWAKMQRAMRWFGAQP